MKDFIEQQIIGAVRGLLSGRVNDVLSELQFSISAVEFGDYCGGSVVVPVIALFACERSEKERIVRLDVYTLSITFALPETPESELFCYAYAAAVRQAFEGNPALGGVVDRAVITGVKYSSPKKPHSGEGWGVVVTLRITVEGYEYAG